MGSISKKIVISGYYGFHNSGDEAVLKSILLALEAEGQRQGVRIEPVVLSINPPLTEKLYGVKAVHRMKLSEVRQAIRESDGLISGGGSLLQDATGLKSIPYYLGVIKLAQWAGKPTFIYSQGIGPVHRRVFYPLIRGVFRKCDYISVRDVESRDLLRRIGVAPDRIGVVPDPVIAMPLPEALPRDAAAGAGTDRPVVGVSVRFWNKDRSDLDRLVQGLARIAAERAVRFHFLPFHLPSDEEASVYVMERLRTAAAGSDLETSLYGGSEDPQAMLAEVSACSLLIGMRLHSLIYAAGQSVPVMGISYDPKIDHFMNRLGMKSAATTEQLDTHAFGAEAVSLLDGREAWIRSKESVIEELKAQAVRPAQEIVSFYAKRVKGW
ncbi:polysaccharide pyruvyl transferase CsaB [Paenibacillus gansuensis]|uniref:Polysaccharide pyruvyl transferase CsaB n=1 Tax=Paenibacillus gansuensis TaxID=306542 RepID=A0ABW5PKG7_9BACL